MGQVVSLVSDSEEIVTHFSLQLAIQTPSFFNTLMISLNMGQRKLQEYLGKTEQIFNTLNKYNDQSSVHTATIDNLDDDGEIEEILETINYYHENEDCRVIVISNDSLLSNSTKTFSDTRKELDSIYKRLKLLAAKLDIVIIVISLKESIDGNKLLPLDNSVNAITYVGTQIILGSKGVYLSKQMKPTMSAEKMLKIGSSVSSKNMLPNKIEMED